MEGHAGVGESVRARKNDRDVATAGGGFGARDFTDEIIARTKQAKALIFVDRLGREDNPEMWEDAVKRGADGIQTDKPGELVKFLKAKGWK